MSRLLGLLSIGLLIPKIGEVIERPFARLGASRYANEGGGFVLGLSLGLVFVPCAGPVLTAISVAAAHHHVGASSLLVTLFYALGVTVPLLVLAVVAQRATTSWSSLRSHLPTVRKVAGVVLGVATLAIAFNWLGALQRDVPGYTSALEDHIESTGSACTQLQHLSGEHQNQFAAANARLEGKKATCTSTDQGNSQSGHLVAGATTTTTTTAPTAPTSPQKPSVFMANKTNLPNLGRAPELRRDHGLVQHPRRTSRCRSASCAARWSWSTSGPTRASTASVRSPTSRVGTTTTRRTAWWWSGVSAPEFAFEHVVSNVENAAGNLGIDYPVAVDDNLATWDAYNNEYWPADYLIDPDGTVRAYYFGEGGYSSMEDNIRMLLSANGVTDLPARTDVPDKTPTNDITPESYVGDERLQNAVGTAVVPNKAIVYHPPATIPSNSMAFGGTWTVHNEEATAGSNATLGLQFTADDVYLVMSGQGTVGVSYNGKHLTTVPVSGIPKLYTLFSGSVLQTGTAHVDLLARRRGLRLHIRVAPAGAPLRFEALVWVWTNDDEPRRTHGTRGQGKEHGTDRARQGEGCRRSRHG